MKTHQSLSFPYYFQINLPILLLLKPSHCFIVWGLIQRGLICSSLIMTAWILSLHSETAGGRPSYKVPPSFMPLLDIFLFDVITLIREIVNLVCFTTSIFIKTPSLSDCQPQPVTNLPPILC